MRRTLTAIMVTALVSGALLLAATLTFEARYSRLYFEAQVLQSAGSGSNTVQVENPYHLDESATRYIPMFIALCAMATFWVVFVVIPSLLASRQLFAGTRASTTVATVVVSIFSGSSFVLMQGSTAYISPMIIFGAGGAIGLVSIVLVARLLPPNTSFERTREG